MSLNKGDIILVTKKSGDWWTGVLDGREGVFPFNYVQEVDPREEMDSPHTENVPEPTEIGAASVQSVPLRSHFNSTASSNSAADTGRQKLDPPGGATSISVVTQPLIARVTVAFQAEQDAQLSLAPGELIKVVKQAANGGWWFGELQSRGKQRRTGWFPANRVELLSSKSSTANLRVSITNGLMWGRHLNSSLF